ncbi:LysR family transcriptional regulator [Marinomonas sp. 15G1-11]|uniref:LysR family transcriptional regulator n=1 Tax=Marinomonas phaeophyticola TaxID=3004091 RepID=A0ABT4JPX2_9GAMM|nr:LysR family transcriptional regulator [Marinomonas sp. 15G1-11]MCZ2720426.1 LysR family transcriptional regulator [Marinomonas sp. 15G1-11]
MSPKIGMRHLQMIQMIAQTGNVSDAATMLTITQSALSHRIREAERLLGTPIFIRRNKKLVPTSAGERLLHAAKVILAEVEKAEFDISKYSAGIEQTVRLGIDHRVGNDWLPELFQNFTEQVPKAEFELVTELSPDPLYCLRNGKIDLCLVSGSKPQAAFASDLLLRDELVVVFLPEHPFFLKSRVEVTDFHNQIYITDTTTPEYHREYEQVFSPNNSFPERVIRVGRSDMIIEFIKSGKGISILPKWTFETYRKDSNLEHKSIGDGFYIDWFIFMRKDEEEGSATKKLAQCMKDMLPSLS